MKKIINTELAPKAVGPYSQAVLAENILYISGQLGIDPAVSKLVEGGVIEQAHQALKNMGEILKEAGYSYDDVVKTTVLLNDIGDFVEVNKVYKEYFTSSYPARAAYQVAALPIGGLVEIEAIAVKC
ncbi:MAG: RidA family protein [Eubacteriaceae bacterium]|nr:RidA family protein [Eubacteriaceae bacterium]